MNAPTLCRRVAVAGTFAMVVVLSACAVTTAPFSPTQATISNRSMTSQFDVLRMQKPTGGIGRLASTADGGVFDFRYY
jgi:hypothetical protein